MNKISNASNRRDIQHSRWVSCKQCERCKQTRLIIYQSCPVSGKSKYTYKHPKDFKLAQKIRQRQKELICASVLSLFKGNKVSGIQAVQYIPILYCLHQGTEMTMLNAFCFNIIITVVLEDPTATRLLYPSQGSQNEKTLLLHMSTNKIHVLKDDIYDYFLKHNWIR